jgi:hypothetical protein
LPADENPKIITERLGHSTVVLALGLQLRFTYNAATNNGEVNKMLYETNGMNTFLSKQS